MSSRMRSAITCLIYRMVVLILPISALFERLILTNSVAGGLLHVEDDVLAPSRHEIASETQDKAPCGRTNKARTASPFKALLLQLRAQSGRCSVGACRSAWYCPEWMPGPVQQ